MKPWMVMCCGCQRLMSPEGKPLEKLFDGGYIPAPVEKILKGTLVIKEINLENVASFDTKPEADSVAKGFGWQIADGEGANHRCPECLDKAYQERQRATEEGRGAILPTYLLSRFEV